jgi:NAD(P)H-hydrate epimerase
MHMPAPRNTAMAVTIAEMRAIEQRAMAAGTSEADLMQLAGTRLGHAIGRRFPHPGCAVAFPGKGHNGGDALIALAVLRDHYGWKSRLHTAFADDSHAALTRHHLAAHHQTPRLPIDDFADPDGWRDPSRPLLLLDGLLGIGGDGSPMRGPAATAASAMNHLRDHFGATIAAVDVPSGINADTGVFPENAVRADITFTLGAVKSGLLVPAAANVVGAISLVAMPLLSAPPAAIGCTAPQLICPQHPAHPATPRPFDFHKGMAGRVSIVAGSENYAGAAVLCASAAIHAGAGLVTLHVPRHIHPLIAAKCPPEIIIRPFGSIGETTTNPAGAWIIGCGLGDGWDRELVDFILGLDGPVVIDADALNTLARHGHVRETRANHLLTPHPGELHRLAPDLAALPPLAAAARWPAYSPATLLLKGCRSIVACRGQPRQVNSTGHPGMASAGQGDVLAGVAGALLAGGLPVHAAAAMAAWLCGDAAEHAIHHHRQSAESLVASHIIAHLGRAFLDWKHAAR